MICYWLGINLFIDKNVAEMHYLFYIGNGLFYANNAYSLRLLATEIHQLDFVLEWSCFPWQRITTTYAWGVFQGEII